MRRIKDLECIMLVDDDDATNFVNKMTINSLGIQTHVQVAWNGRDALDYLTRTGQYAGTESPRPGIIFLDINMPKMNGWEFLEEYKKLPEDIRARIVIAMLTTSLNLDDAKRATQHEELKGYISKPLTVKGLEDIIYSYFEAEPNSQ